MAATSSLRAVIGLDHTSREVAALARDISRVAAFNSELGECNRLFASWSESLGEARHCRREVEESRELARADDTYRRLLADSGAAAESSLSRLQSNMSLDLSPVTRTGRSFEAFVGTSRRSLKDLWKRLEDCYPPNLRSLPTLDAVADIA